MNVVFQPWACCFQLIAVRLGRVFAEYQERYPRARDRIRFQRRRRVAERRALRYHPFSRRRDLRLRLESLERAS